MNYINNKKLIKISPKYAAFTLAEVLITLAVIGVVAAMSIPSLQNNINEAQNKTAWKKEFAQLQQAIYQLRKDNGNIQDFMQVKTFKSAIIGYYQIQKDCGYSKNCGITPSVSYTDYDGTSIPVQILDDGAFITNSGRDFYFENAGSFGIVFVDVNGRHKGPNKLGVDFLGAKIVGEKLLPLGADGTGTNLQATCDMSLNHICTGEMGQFSPPCDGACNSYKYLIGD